MSDNKTKWLKLLKDKKASLYIKPTRMVHDSGFRVFEVGYMVLGKDLKVEDKLILGQCSDHIYTDYMVMIGEVKPFSINMDLTRDGYIRIWSHGVILTWNNSFDWVVSSAEIEMLKEN